MTTTIHQICRDLQNLLMKDADRLGRESGFIQRQRKLTGASFAQALVFGWLANPQASLEELCQSARVCGVQISPQGLQERLRTPQAAAFLKQLLEQSLNYVVSSEGAEIDHLAQFQGVYLQDSTTITLPGELYELWRGNGNQVGKHAILKIQTVFEYQYGGIELHLVPGQAHDCPLQRVDLPCDALRLADIGYFKIKVFETLNQRGVWWVSRLPARVGLWVDNQVINIATWLNQQDQAEFDLPVELTAQRFPCRLIAQRVLPEVAQKRRKAVLTQANRRPHQLRPETLALCDWTVIVTNLPPERLSPSQALTLLRLRWQIELFFKLWKETLALNLWRSQNPWQILCEVYAKLVAVVIQQWLLLLGCWKNPRRSLVKAALVLRKHAFHLASVLAHLPLLLHTLKTILPSLARCSIQKRRVHLATFQLLAHSFP